MFFMRKVLMIIVLAALLLPAQGASAATFAGQNGRIAFGKASGGLWSVRPNGGQAQLLSASNVSDVAWSPSGTHVAFVEPRPNSNKRLRIMNVFTGATHNITNQSDASESSPAWSYDGTRLAFVRTKQERGNKLSAVFTVKAAGDETKNVSGWSADTSYRAPSWAPDNKRLIYEEVGKSNARLLIKDLVGGRVRELTKVSDATQSPLLRWSPNGQKILFNDSEGQVYTIWADGSHRTVISDGDSYVASWSPDGSRIAFLEDFNGEYISISEPDGTVRHIALGLKGYSHVSAPVWSPDGARLVFVATQGLSRKQDLFSIALTGTAPPVRLATDVTDIIAWQALVRLVF